MTRISDETRRKVVRAHIQDGCTIASLVAEYGISGATGSNWVRSYREECQNNDEEKSQVEMMEEKLSEFVKTKKMSWQHLRLKSKQYKITRRLENEGLYQIK